MMHHSPVPQMLWLSLIMVVPYAMVQQMVFTAFQVEILLPLPRARRRVHPCSRSSASLLERNRELTRAAPATGTGHRRLSQRSRLWGVLWPRCLLLHLPQAGAVHCGEPKEPGLLHHRRIFHDRHPGPVYILAFL